METNHHYYHHNLPYKIWYYINSDNYWYEVIWYVYKKMMYTHIYIPVPMRSTYWYTDGWEYQNDLPTIFVTLVMPHTTNEEWQYKWMQVDTIYYLIMNVLLFHILHIMNGDKCGTKREILTKCLYVINTISAQEISSMIKCWTCGYNKSVHSMHLWININISMHGMTKKKIQTETK